MPAPDREKFGTKREAGREGISISHHGLPSGLTRLATAAAFALASACASPVAPIDAAAPSPAALAAEPELAAAAPPRAGERLVFGIALAGLPVGGAELTTRLEHGALRLDVEGGTNPVVGFFYSVHGIARTRLDDEGRSRSFYLRMDEGGKASERALSFRDLPCLYYHPWNDEPWVASLTQYCAPRDPLSLLLELRRLEPASDARDFEVAMTLRSFCYRVRYLGRTDVKVDAGEFRDALLWRVEVRPYRELDGFSGSCDVGPIVGFYDVVLSADAQRLPLRVTREFGFGHVAVELEAIGAAEAETTVAAEPDVATLAGDGAR